MSFVVDAFSLPVWWFPLCALVFAQCYTPPMKFKVLQDNLRKVLWERIEAGELTGLHLAQQTGFKQAHISNFLNKKRGLSIEGMDKVLSVQRLSVLDLLDPAEVSKRATIIPPSGDEFENVVLTDGLTAATQPLIPSMHVKEILKFKKTFLRRLKPDPEGDRSAWQRFVLIKADAKEALSMYPRLVAGATLLLDGSHLILRPHNQASPIEVIAMEEGKSPADYLVGRVCQVGMEA